MPRKSFFYNLLKVSLSTVAVVFVLAIVGAFATERLGFKLDLPFIARVDLSGYVTRSELFEKFTKYLQKDESFISPLAEDSEKLGGKEPSYYLEAENLEGKITRDQIGLDFSTFQKRVSSACTAGSSIRVIKADGTVACESDADTDTDTTYTAGSGLFLSGTEFSVSGLTNAHIASGAAIDWSKISKTGSSLADLTTRSASDLTLGTLADVRLSTNVTLLDTAQTFTANKTFTATSILYLAGGMTYYLNNAGSAYLNALTAVGSLSFPANSITDAMIPNTITASNYLLLMGGTLTGVLTVSGVSGLTDADIPNDITVLNYLLLSGGTMTGNIAFGANIFTISNTDLIANLNADLIDSNHLLTIASGGINYYTASIGAATAAYGYHPCPKEEAENSMVRIGNFCIDKFEASVWSTLTGGTQYGASADNYPCTDNGNDCSRGAANPIYARSVSGVTPSRFITWFQTQQACVNAGKRLPTNAEWQASAAGTPDPGATGTPPNCNVSGSGPTTTGGGTSCLSNFGAENMIGSLWEWVADWFVAGTNYTNSGADGTSYASWPTDYGSDVTLNLGGRAYNGTAWVDGVPAAAIRGGVWDTGAGAGVFALDLSYAPSCWDNGIGFRCAK